MQMTARLTIACTFLAALGISAVSCGDFAEYNTCFANADPSCRPDLTSPTLPSMVGPNPNYPDPNVWKPATEGRNKLDAAPSKAPIRINEVYANLADGDPGLQRIEFFNDTDGDFDASGYIVRSNGIDYTFPDGAVIGAGQFAVVSIGGVSYGCNGCWPYHGLSTLSTVTDFVALIAPDGMICDFVKWGEGDFEIVAQADAEGQWLAGTQCIPVVQGSSLCYAAEGNLPTAFTALWPSIGAPNE